MSETYVLYNPKAGVGNGSEKAKKLDELLPNKKLIYRDMTEITDYDDFFESISAEDDVIICGGDGTLNRFVNATYDLKFKNNILYYATGSGNDFLRDMGKEAGAHPFRINKYIKDLPTVTVNEQEYRFLNGVGYGIDGYCCEVGDKLREKSNKSVNYTSIAIKGLLFGYKPTAATVTADGKTHSYKKVWIAPTMYGCYYGGGMMPAPKQNRNDREGRVSLAVIHDSGKLRTLCVFPSIFKGKHVKHYSMVDVVRGHHITVEFDRPVALQIDGETILNVKKYEVEAAVASKNKKAKRLAHV